MRGTQTGFRCKKCGSRINGTLDSRQTNDAIRRRRRICGRCKAKFTTYEMTKEQYDKTVRQLPVLVTHLKDVRREAGRMIRATL